MNVFQTEIQDNQPQVKGERSSLDLSFSYKTTLKSGQLVPIYWEEIIPGDEFYINPAILLRGLTPIVPVMDRSQFDIYFFFVPMRLCMNKEGQDRKLWQEVMGENINSFWTQQQEKEVPYFTGSQLIAARNARLAQANTWNMKQTIWDYMGGPAFKKTGSNAYSGNIPHDSVHITKAPFFAYQLIWNEYFRDQNTQAPEYLDGVNIAANEPYVVDKLHDLFTDALPAPQKGPTINFTVVGGNVPVLAGSDGVHYMENPIKMANSNYASTQNLQAYLVNNASTTESLDKTVGVDPNTAGQISGDAANNTLNYSNLEVRGIDFNLGTMNQWRYDIALQSIYEARARYGTRFTEILAGQYDVISDNKELQRPEYLGGTKLDINMDTVLQTSGTNGNTALGDTGAFSATFGNSGMGFAKSFTEQGYIIGVCCVRTEQSYFQGIDKRFMHTKWPDFYNPLFEGIGEQPILKQEIYASTNYDNTKVFGYQEPFYEYKEHKNMTTGGLNPENGDQTLSKWTYAVPFAAEPTLNSIFKTQQPDNVAKTLIDEQSESQFLLSAYFDVKAIRKVRKHSIPAKLLGNF